MILLAAVTLVSAAIASGVALFEPAPAQEMAQAKPAYLMDATPVRVIGAPFVPNTDPHKR
jgi:hypothetical protein